MKTFALLLLFAFFASGCICGKKGPCYDGINKYCGLEKDGGDKQKRCIKKFRKNFSEDCNQYLKEQGL